MLGPRGGGLKQIDPTHAPPRPGIAVQVGPGFQQECHAPSGDWDAGFKLLDCLDDQCQAVFLGHASRSMQNALVLTEIIPNAFINGNVLIGMAGRSMSPALRVGPELPLLLTTARGRVGHNLKRAKQRYFP